MNLTPIVEQTSFPSQKEIEIFNPSENQYMKIEKDMKGLFLIPEQLVEQ